MSQRRNPSWKNVTRVELDFVPCPRCEAMASSMVADNGQPFGVACSKCGLHPTKMSVWDDKCKTQLFSVPLTVVMLRDMVDRAQSPACECSIWEGDVLVARWVPKTGMTYYEGRCGE